MTYNSQDLCTEHGMNENDVFLYTYDDSVTCQLVCLEAENVNCQALART